MNSLQSGFLAVVMAATVVALIRLQMRWGGRRLAEWARRENLQILSSERRVFRRGPFDPMGQYWVFRVRAREASGGERSGWVRLGGWFSGPWSDESEARWD